MAARNPLRLRRLNGDDAMARLTITGGGIQNWRVFLAAGISLWRTIGYVLLTHFSGLQRVSRRLFDFIQL